MWSQPSWVWDKAQQLWKVVASMTVCSDLCFPSGKLWSQSLQTWNLWHCLFFLLGPAAVAPGWGPAELLIQRRESAKIDFCPGLHSHVQALLNFARDNELLPSPSSLSKFLQSSFCWEAQEYGLSAWPSCPLQHPLLCPLHSVILGAAPPWQGLIQLLANECQGSLVHSDRIPRVLGRLTVVPLSRGAYSCRDIDS